MRLAFAVLVAITIFHVVHGDMRPSRPKEAVWIAAITVKDAEKPRDVLINRPSDRDSA